MLKIYLVSVLPVQPLSFSFSTSAFQFQHSLFSVSTLSLFCFSPSAPPFFFLFCFSLFFLFNAVLRFSVLCSPLFFQFQRPFFFFQSSASLFFLSFKNVLPFFSPKRWSFQPKTFVFSAQPSVFSLKHVAFKSPTLYFLHFLQIWNKIYITIMKSKINKKIKLD